MNRSMLAAAAFSLFALALAGCDKPAPAKPAGGDKSAAGKTDAAKHDDSTHTHAKDDHAHGGDEFDLGSSKIGVWNVKVSQEGTVAAGEEGHFDVILSGSADVPAAIRMWIGTADAKGSVKAKAEIEKDTQWHAHVEAPKPIADEHMLWIEIEDAKGGKESHAFKLHR